MGSRLLRDWLSFPLMNLQEIKRRQTAVGAMIQLGHMRDALLAIGEIADIERITSRITQGGEPTRPAALRRSLGRRQRPPHRSVPLNPGLPKTCGDIFDELERWLVDDLLSTTEGGLIKQGNLRRWMNSFRCRLRGLGSSQIWKRKSGMPLESAASKSVEIECLATTLR